MKTNRSNQKIRRGKAGLRGFKYLSGLLLGVLLAGLPLTAGACAAVPATSGTATTPATGTTAPATATSPATSTMVTTTTTGSADHEEPASLQLIEPDDALQMLEDNPEAVLLDVRTEQEFASGHIRGAVLIPVDEISARLAELPEDKNTPVIVYCRSGNRSATAARLLTNAGYRTVYDLGGINSWPYEIVR